MDVLFLLLDDDVDIINVAMALVLANDEDKENDDHKVVHHVRATTWRVGWFPCWQGTKSLRTSYQVLTFVVR